MDANRSGRIDTKLNRQLSDQSNKKNYAPTAFASMSLATVIGQRNKMKRKSINNSKKVFAIKMDNIQDPEIDSD